MSLLQYFNSLDTTYKLGHIVLLLGVLAFIVCYLVGFVYKADYIMNERKIEEYTKTQKNFMKMVTIINIIFTALFIIYSLYYLYNYDYSQLANYIPEQNNLLASSILGERDQASYDMKCDRLFSSDPRLNSQYLEMKASRPVSEVRNLCGNYAKNILGKKV